MPTATIYTFHRCKTCKETKTFNPAIQGRIELCSNGHRMPIVSVKGRQRDDIKCGGKCLVATGADCNCSCGGKHHGRYAIG